jgi:hypothetical protein
MVLHFTALGNGSNKNSLVVASWKDRHGHFCQLLSAAVPVATLHEHQGESKHHLQWHGVGTQSDSQPQPKMPIFFSTLKCQSSSSTHVHLFLPQFKCSYANL